MTEQKVKLNCGSAGQHTVPPDTVEMLLEIRHLQRGSAAFAIIPNRSQTVGSLAFWYPVARALSAKELTLAIHSNALKVAEFIFKQASYACAGFYTFADKLWSLLWLKVEDIEEELLQELAQAKGEQDSIQYPELPQGL